MKLTLKYTLSFIFSVTLIGLGLTSCGDGTKAEQSKTKSNKRVQIASKEMVKILKPLAHDTLTFTDSVLLEIKLLDDVKPDSIVWFIGNKRWFSTNKLSEYKSINFPRVGVQYLSVELHVTGKRTARKAIDVFVLSDVPPEKLQFNVLNRYPHNENHFTQGLLYKKPYLYEGTGEWGRSALYKKELKSGKVLAEYKLPPRVFGEGIALFENKMVQLTYKKQGGYVYDLNTFKPIKTFQYPEYMEGWGASTVGQNMLMSNGSARLLLLDTAYFSKLDQLYVCDNNGPVKMLNEIEYVDGVVFANIWLTNMIAKIDYQTGKVLGYLDLSAVVPKKYKEDESKVLNGIAYDPDKDHFYVTGKDWDVLFEGEIE